MRLATLAFLLALPACTRTSAPRPPAQASTPPGPSAQSATPPPTAPSPPFLPPLPSLDLLSSRAPSLAPGLPEVVRDDLSSATPIAVAHEVLRADAADACLRVTLAAQPAVHAWLTDARGNVLADAPSTTDAPLGAKGPVCIRKGDAITLHVEAGGAWSARFVVWASR